MVKVKQQQKANQKQKQTQVLKNIKKSLPAINMMERFVESISQANDSKCFDASFEVKTILGSPQPLIRHRCVTELDREKLEQFVRDFEKRQQLQNIQNNNNNNYETINQNQATTPKNSPYLYRKAKAWISSRNSSPRSITPTDMQTFERNSLPERASYRSTAKMLQFFSNKKSKSPSKEAESTSSPVLKHLPLCNYDNEQDEGIASLGSSSQDSSFELHPPLLPSFKLTPPPNCARKNAAYEFARFLRGSFHAKRASITKLRRSISDSQSFDDIDFQKPLPPGNKNTAHTKKKSTTSLIPTASLSTPKTAIKFPAQPSILVDRTNQAAKQRTAHSMRVSHF